MRGRVEPVPAISLLGGACMSYTFSLSRRSLPVRCLCLLLIVLVLWCFFMVPRAGAVALEATTIAYGGLLVGTILVGAGVVFSSHGDMVKVGNAMYKTLVNGSSAIGKTISSISAWAVEHGASLAKGALRVGKDLYQGIVDAFNSAYSDGIVQVSSDTLSVDNSKHDYADIAAARSMLNSFVAAQYTRATAYNDNGSLTLSLVPKSVNNSGIVTYTTTVVTSSDSKPYTGAVYGVSAGVGIDISPYVGYYFYFYSKQPNGDVVTSTERYFSSFLGANNVSNVAVVKGFYDIAVPTSDLAYPSDNYLVRMPDIPSVDTSTGDVTYPNDTAYTKDAVSVPYPTDADGVKVPDIPYDKIVDQSTGKALDDTGTDTDNPSKPGEGTETGSNTSLLQKILDLLKNFFDSPSDFRLNMDGFRNLAIKDKFPFCIPFDMVDSVKQFAADAADYQFRVKLDTQYFKVDHVVDLTPLAVPLAFFRYLVVAWFAWVLMSRTHDLMKW